MTATPSPKGVEPKEPVPSALDELRQRKQNGEELTIIENCVLLAKNEMAACELAELYQDRFERDEAQKRAEVAEAENVRLTEFMKRAKGQIDAGLAALHGEKSEAELP